jgi:phosphoenolpyruvate carboxylase
MTHSEADYAPLAADIAWLANILDTAIVELSGQKALELVRDLRAQAEALRQGTLEGGREHFSALFEGLSVDDLGMVARSFTLWFHLVNAAEEQHRVRMLRRHDEAHPAEDSLAKAVIAMAQAGLSSDDVQAQLARSFIMPVLTAHPTEARRRTVRDHVAEVQRSIDARERASASTELSELEDSLRDTVIALYATEESRPTKPSPRDEIEAGLDVFQRTLFDATPGLYTSLEAALTRHFPDRDWLGLSPAHSDWVVPSFLRWGSWIGGDRDGNPFVTAHVTRSVLDRHRQVILDRYLEDVEKLGRTLSLSSRRVPQKEGLDELTESIEQERERFPEVAARVRRFTVFEPWREKLWYIAARLRATRERSDQAYVDVGGYRRDLLLLERTLVASGYERLARGFLRECRRRADVFGFHLASLDLRQHSSVHERVVGEVLAKLKLDGGRSYETRDEVSRCLLLHELLARPESLMPEGRTRLSAESQDVLATLDMVGRARREQGRAACERYVVSFTNALSDLLEVLVLQRAAGLSPGELRPVPLLEQLEDLTRASEIAEQMLSSPPLRAALAGELEVMVGYSDSSKQVGYVASQVALRAAQLALAEVAERNRITLTIFHGRGGAIGRGGGPSHQAIRAQPERALHGRIRVTEQGETISTRYGRRDIANRDLEQVVSAVFLSGLAERTTIPKNELAVRDEAFQKAASRALDKYRELIADPSRLARYAQAATPIGEVAALPIGSRPASRKQGLTLADLRAIPWVFSWNQSRHGIPGWFSLGTAIDALIEDRGIDEVRALYRASPFFRALINNAQLALSRADIDVASYYARLADDDAREIFPLIKNEWDRTVQGVLKVIEKNEILGNRPHLLATVQRRNPHVDVLSHTQIELRRRLAQTEEDTERERIMGVLFTTINGIAAGLQTAG